MANMSYCRFENTASDLRDAMDHMDDDVDELSSFEKRARERIISMAVQIALDYGHEIGREVERAAAPETKAA